MELYNHINAESTKPINFKDVIGASTPEPHMVVVWEKARHHEKRVLEEIDKKFQIKAVFEIQWSKKHVEKNFARFYSRVAKGGHAKARKRGKGAFLLIVFNDHNPFYSYRKSVSGGYSLMNANVVDLKKEFRTLPGIHNTIHSSSDNYEFTRDMTLLLGLNYAEVAALETDKKWNGTVTKLNQDLIAAEGWDSLQSLFTALNQTTDYVLLRSYKYILEDNLDTIATGDIDLLCTNPVDLLSISNAGVLKLYPDQGKSSGRVNINNYKIKLDIRCIGDDYFDMNWQRELLDRKVIYNDTLSVLRIDDWFFSTLYEQVVHKGGVSNKYVKLLYKAGRKIGLNELTIEKILDLDYQLFLISEYFKGQGYLAKVPKDKNINYKKELIDNINSKVIKKPEKSLANILKKKLRPYYKFVKKFLK